MTIPAEYVEPGTSYNVRPRRGESLSDFVLDELTRIARTPTPEEIDERIGARGPAGVSTDDILAARDAPRRS